MSSDTRILSPSEVESRWPVLSDEQRSTVDRAKAQGRKLAVGIRYTFAGFIIKHLSLAEDDDR